MVNNQKSETEDFVQIFYSLMYRKFNSLLKESIDKDSRPSINDELGEDDFISNFIKNNLKNFIQNGSFAEEKKDPYLEFHKDKEEEFVFITTDIKYVKDHFNNSPFEKCEDLAEEMGYVYKSYSSTNNNYKTRAGFRIPYSDFEGEIIFYAFKEQFNQRINDEIFPYKKRIKDLEENNKRRKGKNTEYESYIRQQKESLIGANKKIEEKNKEYNKLRYSCRNKISEFKKFRANYGIVIYNIWRMGRTIEKNYKSNKQIFENMNTLIKFFGKNLKNIDDRFEDKGAYLEFLEDQKLLMNESLKSLEKSNKQYNRVSILIEKSGIKIEEYDDIKNIDKLNVTILDVIESPDIQEIIVETVKPSIYYAEKRIFEGEVILTKPKK